MRVRPTALALHGVLLAALVAGPMAFVAAEKSVTIDVDGDVRTVGTYAATVGDLLAESRLTVGTRDELAPTTETALTDGMRVVVLRGRPVRLQIDGVEREIWTTARTVDELANQLDRRFETAYLSTTRSTRIPLTGLRIDVRLPKTVTLSVGGTAKSVLVTTAATWTQALTDAGVTLGPLDVPSLALSSKPEDGQTMTVTRVATRLVSRSVTIPFSTSKVPDAAMYQGESPVAQAGSNGRYHEVWKYVLHNGRSARATLVSRKLAANPVPRIIHVGTKRKPVAVPKTSVSGLNWPALARCESGGNPRAVGGGGAYFGLYQFTLGTWRALGGTGSPVDAAAAEQTYRAQLLYLRSGADSWPYCGQLLFS